MERDRSGEKIPLVANVELISGPMFGGKTGVMIEMLVRQQIAGRIVQVFKPDIDIRYDQPNSIVSHAGSKFDSTRVNRKKPKLILELVNPETDVIAIDEAQFFSKGIVDVVETLVKRSKKLIVAGLPTDFRGEPFGSMPRLLAIADNITYVHAVCVVCGGDGTKTQRMIDGKPAKYSDPIIIVGADELYEARCRAHHEVPR